MNTEKEYDLAFSLGAACLCSGALRACSLQFLSFPFDWIIGLSIVERAGFIAKGFEDFIKESELKFAGSVSVTAKDVYTSSSGLYMNHDFPIGISLHDSFPAVREKYLRRGSRLISLIEASRRVLVAYALLPDAEMPPEADLSESIAILRSRFPTVEFDLLVMKSTPGLKTPVFKCLAPGITLATIDYRSERSGGGALKGGGHDAKALNRLLEGVKVRDYRSDEERNRYEAREREKIIACGSSYRKGNYRLFGDIRLIRFKIPRESKCALGLHPNETPLATFRSGRMAWAVVRQHGEFEDGQLPLASDMNAIVRVRLAVRRVLQFPIIFLRGLFLRRKRFAHFLLLGYNYEAAYRFIMKNGFLDSTFFAWTDTGDCAGTARALQHFDELFTGELRFASNGRDLFVDVATGVVAYSRYSPKHGEAITIKKASDIESEKAELRSRMAHLRDKFYRQLRDDEPTLAVVKMRQDDCPKGDYHAHRFLERLREMGGRNLQLLVICQKADAVHFPAEHPDYFLRTVSRYNPDWLVTTEQVGDRFGWTMIWKEFAPLHVMAQSKKYKFDR